VFIYSMEISFCLSLIAIYVGVETYDRKRILRFFKLSVKLFRDRRNRVFSTSLEFEHGFPHCVEFSL
jgi:hypothetical protein